MGWGRFFRRGWWDEERARELEAHLEIETDENIARGMSPAAARMAARRKLGDPGRVREEIYVMNSLPVLDTLWQDVRYGARQFARSPGFAAVAILTLAVGIGGVTIIYSVVRNILLDPFPYAKSDRMVDVVVRDTASGRFRGGLSGSEFLDFQEQSAVFEDVIGTVSARPMTLWVNGGTELVGVAGVTPNTFAFLGVPALLGRGLLEADGRPNAPPVAVLSHRAWVAHFGSAPGVVGRTVSLDRQARTIVGVMPPRFTWHVADFWVPTPLRRGGDQAPGGGHWFQAHLKRGVSTEQAEAELNVIAARRARQHPDEYPKQFRIAVITVIDWVVGRFRGVLYTLFAAVALLLLIACCNVANMLLARAGARERELTVRAALGASRRRLVRQMLVESLLLALAGGVAGCAVAYWGLAGVAHFLPQQNVPYEVVLRMDGHALLFSLLTACATAVLFGLLPAWHGARRNLVRGLKEASKGTTTAAGRGWVRNGLVVVEVALSMVLLLGAGFLMRSFVTLVQADRGFEPSNIVLAGVHFPEGSHPTPDDRSRYYDEATRRIRLLPGLVEAGRASGALGGRDSEIEPLGEARSAPRPGQFTLCTEGYLRVFGLAPLRGRLLTAADVAAARRVAVVDERLVAEHFPGKDPIGRHIRIPGVAALADAPADATFEIVGVVRSIRIFREAAPSQAYLPSSIASPERMWLAARISGDSATMLGGLRRTLRALDPNVAVTAAFELGGEIQESHAQQRFVVLILGAFAVLGLLLVAVGVYGVMAYAVSLRTPELAVRMALGADRPQLLRTVLGSGSRVLTAGVVVGALASLGTNRLLADMAWSTGPYDPVTMALAAAVSLGVGLAACLVPALRAARVDPMVTLRQE